MNSNSPLSNNSAPVYKEKDFFDVTGLEKYLDERLKFFNSLTIENIEGDRWHRIAKYYELKQDTLRGLEALITVYQLEEDHFKYSQVQLVISLINKRCEVIELDF